MNKNSEDEKYGAVKIVLLFCLIAAGVLYRVFNSPTDPNAMAMQNVQMVLFCTNPITIGVSLAVLLGIVFFPKSRR